MPSACPSCHAPLPEGSRFCPSCGSAVDASDLETRLGDDRTRLAGSPAPSSGGGRSGAGGSGWLSSSGSIDHGRFSPGAVLDGRYRIIGLLGRGGMGEVYRADDLRLGQPVALKFLPKALASDARRLAQFHNEVRTARQVSHPNVCRVYDIGEADGDLYLSMEYVDGEDLAASLKRVGRFPEDRAVELARQICAGLAAAHERGVIHRDLKPANVMLDAAGKVRLMDFGLAAIGEVGDVRVGTPAYMAPEQLEGREVTIKSDIYALGLVLYEIFTGRRAYTATTIAELLAQQSGPLTSPADLVKSLDPAIERAILRCGDRDPARRPASALTVSAALPGGDPLAAALAAGETPSPEMVAAAGGEGVVLSPTAAAVWIAVAVVALALALAMSRFSMFNRIPLDKPPEVLADRAEQIREQLGYTEPVVDRAAGFVYSGGYLTWAKNHGAGATRWKDLAAGQPAPIYFWRRTSPRVLVPADASSEPTRGDPPLEVAAMTLVDLDTTGRLLRFVAVPPEVETPAEGTPRDVDWTVPLTAAGFDPAALQQATPERTPGTYADERRAWQGTFPGTETAVRLEAAAYRGKVVYFAVIGPWSVATRDVAFDVRDNETPPVQVFIVAGLLVLAAVLARRNVKSGRADRRGSFRLAVFTFGLMMASWLFSPHVPDVSAEWLRFLTGVAFALLLAGAMYIIYLALEPFVRRSWPTTLVGWTRLLSGRVRDPLIGRDLLVGAALGAVLGLVDNAYATVPAWFGRPESVPHQPQSLTLLGGRSAMLTLLGSINNGLQSALFVMLEFALVRDVVMRIARRRKGAAAAGEWNTGQTVRLVVAMIIVTFVGSLGNLANSWWVLTLASSIETALTLIVMIRFGLLPATVMFMVDVMLQRMPLTLDSSKFFAPGGWLAVVVVTGAVALGAWLARQRAFEPGRIGGRA
jgi:hypothetical protein